MARTKTPKRAPMQQAVAELLALGRADLVTPEQYETVAAKYDVELWALEGYYLDALDRGADE